MFHRGGKGWIPLVLLAFFFVGYVLYPLLTLGTESVQTGQGVSIGRYRVLFDPAQPGNVEAVVNSVSVSLLSVVVGGLVGLTLAFTVTQLRFPLRRVLETLAIVPVALPPLVGVLAFLLVFGESGLLPRLAGNLTGVSPERFAIDGIPAIIAVHVYSFNVYFFLFLVAAFRRLDGPGIEAATGLGAGPFAIFRRVVLPQLRPALLGASILTFLSSMSSFSAPLLFAGGHRFITLQIYTTKMNGDLNLAAAQSLLLTIVSMVFFVVLQVTSGSSVEVGRTKGTARPGRLSVPRPVRVLLIVISATLVLLEMLPLLVIVLVSFAREGAWTWQLLPSSYTTDNYVRLLTDPQVWTPIRNSIVVSIVALVGVTMVGVTGAYLTTKGIVRKYRITADVLLSLPYAIPGTVLAIGLILAYRQPTLFTGFAVLVGTFWMLPLAYLLRTYPLMMRSASASLARLDDGILEAADVSGAGEWQKFRRIVVPMILPGIIAGASLTLIELLGEFVSSILLYTYSTRPIAVEILAQVRSYNLGSAAAYSVFLLLLILLVVWGASRLQRRWGRA